MKKHDCVFFNTQDQFLYGFQLILIKQNFCLSNFNLGYNKMVFIYGFHLSSLNSSKAVTKQKCYKNWLAFTWKSFHWKRVSNQLILPFVLKQLGGLHEVYMKPDMKIDRYETEKSHIAFWSSLPECLSVQKWYEIHIGVDFISVILTDLKFNTRYESLCTYL